MAIPWCLVRFSPSPARSLFSFSSLQLRSTFSGLFWCSGCLGWVLRLFMWLVVRFPPPGGLVPILLELLGSRSPSSVPRRPPPPVACCALFLRSAPTPVPFSLPFAADLVHTRFGWWVLWVMETVEGGGDLNSKWVGDDSVGGCLGRGLVGLVAGGGFIGQPLAWPSCVVPRVPVGFFSRRRIRSSESVLCAKRPKFSSTKVQDVDFDPAAASLKSPLLAMVSVLIGLLALEEEASICNRCGLSVRLLVVFIFLIPELLVIRCSPDPLVIMFVFLFIRILSVFWFTEF